MREIIKITIALTISCLVAGLVIGTTFIFTARAKQQNEHLNVQQTMLGLLGYGKNNPAPPELRLRQVHRYIVKDGASTRMGYLLPVEAGSDEGYELMLLDLNGNFIDRRALAMTGETALSADDRKKALVRVMKPSMEIDFADTMIIACMGDRRSAYLLPGEFPGFKTFIKAMVALGADFEMLGLEVIEHEEDPGLGAEITQDYFKNQFIGKSFEKLRRLTVVKEPIPADYEKFLKSIGLKDGGPSAQAMAEMEKRYQDKDIHALTGATISSTAVTLGVRNMVKKFAYRIQIMDRAIDAGGIPVLF
ncbi:FMN-binding protein [Desulfosarcina sp.]|uniref:FMN-binding protein n=1 Tax=Desulfosarcina sp. TaxID=2027861 RepID=UPI0039707366